MLIIASAITVSVMAHGVASNAQTLPTKTDEEAVKAVIVAMTEAFNRHDAKAWTRLATLDAQLVTVRGESMNGVVKSRRD